MACKTCGDENIADAYNCHTCDIKQGKFKWCVITDVPRNADGSDAEGNCYDDTRDLKDIDSFVLNGKFVDFAARTEDKRKGIICFDSPVFFAGEMFPVANWGREMIAGERKPDKWDVEYELFAPKDYKKALLRSIEATKEYNKPYDNLRHLESKFNKSKRYMDHG